MTHALAVGFLTIGPLGFSLPIFFIGLFGVLDIELHEIFVYSEGEFCVTLFANNCSHSEGCVFILFYCFLFLCAKA